MAERPLSTPAVYSWKSLWSQQLSQESTSLGLILDRVYLSFSISIGLEFIFYSSYSFREYKAREYGRTSITRFYKRRYIRSYLFLNFET
jgi:hypothetical protein